MKYWNDSDGLFIRIVKYIREYIRYRQKLKEWRKEIRSRFAYSEAKANAAKKFPYSL